MRAFNAMPARWRPATGKTTVMGMLAAWSILNKVNGRSDGRFSDAVLVVCPNVTIKDAIAGIGAAAWGREHLPDARSGTAAPDAFPGARQGGRYNWHIFEPRRIQTGGTAAKVNKAGVRKEVTTTVLSGGRIRPHVRHPVYDSCIFRGG